METLEYTVWSLSQGTGGGTLDGVPNHHREQSHTHSQFGNVSQPTMYVYGLRDETRVQGGAP